MIWKAICNFFNNHPKEGMTRLYLVSENGKAVIGGKHPIFNNEKEGLDYCKGKGFFLQRIDIDNKLIKK